MARKRVHEIAKAQGVTSKELLEVLRDAGIEAKAAASNVEEAEALKAIAAAKADGGAPSADAAGGNGAEATAPKKAPAPGRAAGAKPAAPGGKRPPAG